MCFLWCQTSRMGELFVKHVETANAVAYLQQSETFHSEAKHPAAIPKLLHSFPTLNGYAHVNDWIEKIA